MGDIYELHGRYMPILWAIVIDLLIITATFSSSKIANFAHSLGGAIVIVITILLAFPIISDVFDGLDPVHKFKFYFHVFLGCLCMIALLYVWILGSITKILNFTGKKSIYIMNARKLHITAGIIVTILLKVQVYVKLESSERPTFIIIDGILIAVYLYRKFGIAELKREQEKID